MFLGYLALFQIATFKGWMAVMDNAVDMSNVSNFSIRGKLSVIGCVELLFKYDFDETD